MNHATLTNTILRRRTILIFLFLSVLMICAAAVWWIGYLQKAHSTFDNYYAFRGCARLIEKTDTYGICETNTGATIKLVLFEGNWYLDGDLPPGI